MCEVWADHEFGAGRVLASGQDPFRGAYQRVARTCDHCNKITIETQWTEPRSVGDHLRLERKGAYVQGE